MASDGNLDTALETLAFKLTDIGYQGEMLSDAELVEVATERLDRMFLMLKVGVNIDLLKATML